MDSSDASQVLYFSGNRRRWEGSPALHESSAPRLCKELRCKSAATCGNSPPSKHVRYVMRRLNLAPLFLLLFVSDVAVLGQQDQTSPAPATQSSERTSAPAGYPVDKPSPSPATTTAEQPRPENPKLDLTPDANGALSQEQMQQLFRVVADKDIDNDKRLRDYTYIERDVQNRLDGKGQVKSTETKTYQVMEIYGEQINRLIQKDDKPLSEKDAAKEEKKVQKVIDKRRNESASDRRKREEKEEKDREDGRKFVREVADAYNFKLVGTELVGGREAWVIDGEPRPDFVPHMKESKFLSKFRGRVWVDKNDLQLAKMDIEVIDTVSLGWVLARIHKGTHVMLEQARVNDEVWLPRHLSFKLDARIALFKGYNVDGDQTFRDYKKFRTSTKIVGYGEVKRP